MAKTSRSITFKNATIDTKDGTITEYTKDDTKVYLIENLLEDWNGIDGVSISIRREKDVAPDE